jgi:peptidase M1-like protein
MVIRKLRQASLVAVCLVLGIGATTLGRAQNAPNAPIEPSPGPAKPVAQSISAEALYLQLRSVGLDKSRVYRIRETAFDRAAFHFTLDDGTIAFTEDVFGRITGAFFEGDGEVLLVPPDQPERASMAMFTGAAILEERFVTAYFRFNDETFAELQPSLRPADDSAEFISQWNETAHNLAQSDALRLLLSFSQFLPVAGQPSGAGNNAIGNDDRMLHARLQGRRLGNFDLYYDGAATEQIWAGQLRTVEGTGYFDVWTAFALNRPAQRPEVVNTVTGEVGGVDAISCSSYQIKTEVKPPTRLDVQAWLQMEVRQGGQRAVLFELSRFLQIKQIEVDGHPLEFIQNQALEGTQLARRGNDLVALVFTQPLRTGQRMELHFVYGGEVLSEAGGGLLYVGARGTWYPNRGLAMSKFDLEFRYPENWTLVATGKRVDSSPAASASGGGSSATLSPGEQVSRWISDRPIPVAGFNLGKYARVVAQSGSVTVETYAASAMERAFPKNEVEIDPAPLPRRGLHTVPVQVLPSLPPSPSRNAQTVADASARALQFFGGLFGPYPYSSLAVTQMPGVVSQGWPGLIFLSSYAFLTPAEKSQQHMSPVAKTLSEQVIAHETAHQWWGDAVLWSGYRDQWIMEALANYSSLMLLQSQDPSQFRAVMGRYREDLLEKNKEGVQLMNAGPVTFGARLSCSHFPAGYEAISYGRGTWLFHMLRSMMRDAETTPGSRRRGTAETQSAEEPFIRALRVVRERYEGKSITTRELLRVFEEQLPPSLWYEGKKSLDWFYQGWINGTAIPKLELQAVKYADKAGSTAISGTILQKNGTNELVTSVPVYGVSAGKTVLIGRVFADGPETQFHLTAPPATRRIILDPNQTLLTRVR